MNYYNEWNHEAANWMRELIAAAIIPKGEIDERSITDVRPDDLRGYTQCHFFAGIGGWPYALRLAGWPDDKPVWTGSCPCQPFSCAGQRKGHADERHLWPSFHRLISECSPAIAFGEQVASKDGREWLAGIRADLEGLGYACGGADLCAAGISAPHIRQRLFWVAYANKPGDWEGRSRGGQQPICDTCKRRGGVANVPSAEILARSGEVQAGAGLQDATGFGNGGIDGRLVNTPEKRPQVRKSLHGELQWRGPDEGCPTGFWSDAIWHWCKDEKFRRISPEPSLFPLAYGVPGRLGCLRGAGNAIVPELAAEFIQAACESFR